MRLGGIFTLPLTTPVIPSSIPPLPMPWPLPTSPDSTSETSQRPSRTRQQHYPKTQQGQRQSRVGTLCPKRLAETKHMSQAEWLSLRRQGFGSSDCAAACGLNPYMSMLELWMIKTGRIQQSIEDDSAIQAFQSKLSTLDYLKKHRPKSHTFPNQFDLSVAVIYSSASKVDIQKDFYNYLNEYRDEFNFDEKPVSLSDVDALSHVISSCVDHDIVVIIRGGGSSEAFDIFNDEKVLKAFSNLNGYRIVGLVHNTDVTLLDYLADHSAITPSDAGIHLKGQFDELFSRNDLLEQLKIKNFKLESDLKAKSDEVIALSANVKQLSERTDIQTLINENKELDELNHELKQQVSTGRKYDESNKKGSVMMFIIAIVAAITGVVLGRLI
ncbi:exodeoxyribonuclease VII large subunit [Acinetobacter baumannii]|uniref:exodeoxyribonuclease VII large subunit n=1 Tax=Acinetobacter baumannii TaxID=470 RepID=UPI003AF53B23